MSRRPSAADDMPGASSQRSKGRDSLFLTAQVAFPGDHEATEVRIRNLSPDGLMAEIVRTVTEGTPVALLLRGIGEVTGTVAWNAEGRIGVALDRTIDPKLARKPVGKGGTTPSHARAPRG